MKTLVIGDIHQKIDQVEKIISDWTDQIIFIGDYFDDFNDTVEDARRTAQWLKQSLQRPNRVHLMGNHDYNYRIRPPGAYYCTGFTLEKYEAINLELSISDWKMIKYFHHEKDDTTTYWFSHAGLGGAVHLIGTESALTAGIAGSIGFDAITVALLGQATPIGTLFGAFLFGALQTGGRTLLSNTGTSNEIIQVIQALIVLFIAAPALLKKIFRLKKVVESKSMAAKGWNG